jgi:Sigma-70, region 4
VSSLDDPSSSDPSADSNSPEQHYLHAERDAELRDLVFALPDPARDAVALRYGSGLSAREIGGVIGKSESATQKLIQRARLAREEYLTLVATSEARVWMARPAGAQRAVQTLNVDVEVLPLGSSYHEAGGVRMSDCATDRVVDSFGRFWADPRVRVRVAS